MHNSVDKLIAIQNEIQEKSIQLSYNNYKPNIVAVSKTFPLTQVMPLINHGHIHFGENKVQEATEKWLDIKNNFEYVGDNFAYEARSIHYDSKDDKKNKKGIYGSASLEEVKELQEEGIKTETIPWIKEEEN